MTTPGAKKQLFVPFMIWIVVIVGIRILNALGGIPFIYNNLMVITAVLLIYPPVILSFFDKKPIAYWSLERCKLQKSLFVSVLVSTLIFALALAGNHFYQKIFFHLNYHAGHSDIWPAYILTQFLLVAFPEEFFFRGYIQEKLLQVWPAHRKIFGVPFGGATLVVAAVFALSHSLISLQWWHAFIFFPALVFGWLKEKTGTIWAGVLFHGLCNLFAYWVALHY